MFALAIPTISTWFNQGSVANPVSGTSSSGTSSAAQSSPTPSNGTQLSNAFDNLISQIKAANQPSGVSTPPKAASGPSEAVHGHHGHGGGGGLSALLQQLEQMAASNTSSSTSALSALSSTGSAASATSTGATSAVSSASATNLEATLNQLLQTLKLAGSSTNVAALNSATTAQGSLSLAQRLAQQGVPARAGNLLSAVV
jgi:hypothetical protein